MLKVFEKLNLVEKPKISLNLLERGKGVKKKKTNGGDPRPKKKNTKKKFLVTSKGGERVMGGGWGCTLNRGGKKRWIWSLGESRKKNLKWYLIF